jgi:hypothetical protein
VERRLSDRHEADVIAMGPNAFHGDARLWHAESVTVAVDILTLVRPGDRCRFYLTL